MAKIRIDDLPEGFELKDGQIVENKQSGGKVTGDQSNYGLVTTNPSMDVNQNGSEDVRYSLSKVPRDQANVEAEGGETVLTDLNGDGMFGLYDINGPRHANGGVPLFLPEQSFVFSDYNKLKFDKQEMAELGIESKKKKTPAKISKKFGLNEYYGKIKDPYADSIQIKSAELMMDKNKMKLSQLAFMQEAKKDFEDGVPLSSYPYLLQQDIDPIEFTQQVEQISREKAEEKAIQSLPPQQQMQLAALQQYMEQVDQQEDADELAENDIQQDQEMQQPMAKYGAEMLPKFQQAGEYSDDPTLNKILFDFEQGSIDPLSFKTKLEDYGITYNDLMLYGESIGAVAPKGLTVLQNKSQQIKSVDTLYRLQDLMSDLNIEAEETEDRTGYKIILDLQKRIVNGDQTALQDLEELGYQIEELESTGENMSLDEIKDFFNPIVNKLEDKFLSAPPPVNPEDKNLTGALGSTFGGRITPVLRSSTEYDQNIQDYQDLERALLSNDDEWQNVLEKTYDEFVKQANAKGVKNIPSKQDVINNFLAYQKNNYDVRNITTDQQRFDPNLDRSQSMGLGKNEYTQEFFNTLKQQNPEYAGYEIDDDVTKANQLFFQILYSEDQKSDNPKFDVFEYGPEQTTNWEKNRKISPVEGFYGNNTLNQLVKVKKESKYPDVEGLQGYPVDMMQPVDESVNQVVEYPDVEGLQGYPVDMMQPVDESTDQQIEEEDAGDDATVEDKGKVTQTTKKQTSPYSFFPQKRKRTADFWLQDVLKTNAIRNRKRQMFLPFQPAVTPVEMGYVLEDPTRAIAAQNEQFNIGAQAMGAFAGPQATSARLASMQGKAAEQIANTIAGVNQRNVNTINRGEMQNARMNLALAQEERRRMTKLYDDTQVTLQKYMNELNFDREQYADALANMYTNRANTYNLNQLYDYYQVDPSSGGMVEFTSGESFKKAQQQDEMSKLRVLAQMQNDWFQMTNTDLPDAYINKFLGVSNTRNTTKQTRAQQEMQNQMGNIGYAGNRTQRRSNNQPIGRKGKEIKKYAVPFYAGKMSL